MSANVEVRMPKSQRSTKSKKNAPRTRGGWIPAGTSAERRANHGVNSTSRGRRSRQRLIEAARHVFERIGYFDATIDDIITEAEMARGSFYTYFPDKLSIFQVLALEINEAVSESVGVGSVTEGMDPVERLESANRRYVETYRKYAAIYGLIEQVATIDPTIRADRQRNRTDNVARVAETIRGWQARGLADPELHPESTAALLVSMTSNFCYWWLVGGEDYGDSPVNDLTDTWVRVTGLRKRPRPTWVKVMAARNELVQEN